MDINYIGEHLLPGNVGSFSVALTFGGSLLALIFYFFATYDHAQDSYKKWARWAFGIHGLAVFGIVITLFYIIHSHYFEYYYVWAHSSLDLPVEFMISCFWEGQEGSFLLWTFWHVFIGAFIIRFAGKWEAPVMLSITLAQVALSSMLLGLEIWGAKIGSNPFILLRQAMEAPIFSDPHYLSQIADGNGLNPLLQNYWMVIHPPVLFLGFAAAVVPFGYALAALIRNEYQLWVKPALVWTTFTVGILGTGILMGGAWAYEALSFGGFWTWDPVENAVLVPWLFLVAGLHTLLIYKHTGKALLSSIILLMAGFILILYATFLTRSGILGDSSVHSFTDLGLSGQLLLFLFGFVYLSIHLLFLRRKDLPKSGKDEQVSSREFWMFIGSLVLIVSGFQVIFSTSIPVFNTIFNSPWLDFIFKEEVKMAPPTDPISHYNKFQIPFAILIAILTAATQYLKYKKTSTKLLIKKIAIAAVLAAFFSVFFIWKFEMSNAVYIALLWASWFTVIGNFDVMWPLFTKKKWLNTSSSITHIGIGLILVGALISNANKKVISLNKTGLDYGDGFAEQDKRENVYLPKGEPKLMDEYLVTYMGDSVAEPNHYYKVRYKKVNFETNEVLEEFVLTPNAQINLAMGGLISSPSTKRYWGKDVYTHVTSIDAETDKEEDYINTETFKVKTHDTVVYKGFKIIVKSIIIDPEEAKPLIADMGSVIATSLPITVKNGKKEYKVSPLFILKGNQLIRPASDIEELGLRFHFVNIDTECFEYEMAVSTKNDNSPQFIIMKALIFPYINLLWLGSILLFIGSMMAMIKRIEDLDKKRKDKELVS